MQEKHYIINFSNVFLVMFWNKTELIIEKSK